MDKRSILFVVLLTAALFFTNRWFDHKEQERKASQTQTAQIKETTAPKPISRAGIEIPEASSQEYYVLENNYQQIVFTNVGGSITEINLPFRSEGNTDSVVLPIGFDRTIEKDYPSNDLFPSVPYLLFQNGEVTSVKQGKVGGYYPLLRRNVYDKNRNILHAFSPKHYACNIVSEEENTHSILYKVTQFTSDSITFEGKDGYRKITKTYTLTNQSQNTPYCFDLDMKIEGDTRGLWMTGGIPEVELISGNFSPNLKYLMMRSQKPQVETLSLPKNSTTYSSISPSWVSNSNGFLGLIFQPLSEIGSGFKANNVSGSKAPTRLSIIDSQYDLYPLEKYPGYELWLPIKALSSGSSQIRIFAGPYEDDIFQLIDSTISERSENPNFTSALSFQGWFTFISEPFAKFLFILMKFFYKITHSWGFSIILLTAALRVMLYPLNGWSIKSSLRMQQIAPQVTAIQERHKKDPKKAQMEVVALYREKGVNPLTGCLPILIQIPFLIGMFDLLKSAFELRGAPFIPGWIDNLTSPDVLFSWNYPFFFFGTSLHLLPIILGAVMYVQQRFSSPLPKDKRLLTDQQKQQKMMGNIMVIVFTVMFYHFPSGLNLYWLSSMAFGILQQWFMNKKLKTQPKK